MVDKCSCRKKLYGGICLFCSESQIKARLRDYDKEIWRGIELNWEAINFLKMIKKNRPKLTKDYPILFDKLK